MASTDAIPVPKKNTAYRHIFAIRDNSGDLITTWAGQDSELSQDGGAFADATNEATEIGTSGVGYIDLTSGEMNYDSVVLKVTVTNTDAIDYVVVLYPEEAGDIRANANQIGGTTQTGNDNGADINTILSRVTAAVATAAALATVDGNVDSILVDTGTTLPAQISGLNNISEAEVNAQCDTAISDAALATAAAITALNNLSQANIRTALGMATANLDTQLDLVSTFDAATEKVNIGEVNDITIDGAGTEVNPWGPA